MNFFKIKLGHLQTFIIVKKLLIFLPFLHNLIMCKMKKINYELISLWIDACLLAMHKTNPKRNSKKHYKQINTLKLEMNGIWKKQNLFYNWNHNLKKFPTFPHWHKTEERGVVPIWRARKNQEKAKDQQRNILTCVK
jgi:hypothetical protein